MGFAKDASGWKYADHPAARLENTLNFVRGLIQILHMLENLIMDNKVEIMIGEIDMSGLNFPNDILIATPRTGKFGILDPDTLIECLGSINFQSLCPGRRHESSAAAPEVHRPRARSHLNNSFQQIQIVGTKACRCFFWRFLHMFNCASLLFRTANGLA